METEQEYRFKMHPKYLFMGGVGITLLVVSLLVIPILIAFNATPYPNLSVLPVFVVLGVGFSGALILAGLAEQTVSVTLNRTDFVVKKWGQRAITYPYTAIVAHNERPNWNRWTRFDELTVYLPDNWFLIRSNEYADYDYLKENFTYFGQTVPYQKVITLAERNRSRGFLAGMALLIIASIVFGFVAHNPVSNKPARLASFSAPVAHVRQQVVKGNFKGVSFHLPGWPALDFYASRHDFEQDLQPLYRRIDLQRPVTLLLLESDIQKKLLKTKPLTIGDRYIDYNHVAVFGIRQGAGINLRTPQPVEEPTRTSPYVRLFFFGMLLAFCGTAWVWVEQQRLLL